MKKQYVISGLFFAAIMLAGSHVWAQWTTTGNTTWTNNNIEIRGDRAFMQDGFQVAKITKGNDPTNYTNLFVGASAGSNMPFQTAVGWGAGAVSTSDSQTAFGALAGFSNTGTGQTAFGRDAGRGNSGAVQLVFGAWAGENNTGDFQVALGAEAGRFNSGIRQTVVGYQAGRDNSGGNQIGIGMYAGKGNTANNCVFIGYEAGLNNALDNQFIVKQSLINPKPLIRGDFATGEIRVQGKITAQEVEVTLTGWPDYVFSEDYNLASLNDVEKHINSYKHLPGVPTESDVIENGVNLGEMTSVLLKKIEELTLYMIALNNQNDELRLRIEELEK